MNKRKQNEYYTSNEEIEELIKKCKNPVTKNSYKQILINRKKRLKKCDNI